MCKKKVLLCSVFGPYGQDDEYGSRRLNPMELYHNQVTRTQGAFSLRMFHRSWGLMMIQANVTAPCVLLDFPTLDRFIQEIRDNKYDIVGISSIIPNIFKVKKMCELIRQYLPQAIIVVGGHITNMPDLNLRIDADHIVRGEGIRWFRRYLGEDEASPIKHPLITSGLGARNCGITLRSKPGDIAATIIPSVGCPKGCNFCSTSAMFGGKGHWFNFYKTGRELFVVMRQIADNMRVRSFFIMDENFLLHKQRAMEFLELMEFYGKPWSLYVFTSADVLRNQYTIDELVRLGVSWVWMGLEGRDSQYQKLKGINTFELVAELQANGINVLGSSIIGLENHTMDNIDEVIDHAVRHGASLHQFMLYTPIPGTPLHAELTAQGQMKNEGEYHLSDIHGQSVLNYRHPRLTDEQTTEIMERAFNRDFAVNGPSVVRIVRVILEGWKKYKHHSDFRVRDRIEWEARKLSSTYSALLRASQLYYQANPVMYKKMSDLLFDLRREFGLKSWFYSMVGGLYVLNAIYREERRLANGFAYEPPTFIEANEFVQDRPNIPFCRSVRA